MARVLFALLALASIGCFAAFAWTGERRHRDRGLLILKGAVTAGLLFFAVLLVERLMAS